MVRPITEDERTSATGLWSLAESYRDAANHLAQNCKLRHDAPLYFLYAHALELALKAYLRAKGATTDEMRCVDRRLTVLLTVCRERGLDRLMPIDQEDEGVLALLDELNREHEFRDIKAGFNWVPDLATLRSTATDLLNAIRPVCLPSPPAPRVPEDA